VNRRGLSDKARPRIAAGAVEGWLAGRLADPRTQSVGFGRLAGRADPRTQSVGFGSRAWRGGFSLLEVLLVLPLIGVLLGLSVVSLDAWQRGQRLSVGADRLSTCLRLARADAADRGRRIRLVMRVREAAEDAVGSDDAASFELRWEAEPLAKPGVFEPYHRCNWQDVLPGGLVRVTQVELLGESALRFTSRDTGLDESGGGGDVAAITFYPDGTSDAARIVLAAADGAADGEADERRAVLELSGLSGEVRLELRDAADVAMSEADVASAGGA